MMPLFLMVLWTSDHSDPEKGPSPSRARLKLAVTSVPWHRSQDKVTIKQTIKHVR